MKIEISATAVLYQVCHSCRRGLRKSSWSHADRLPLGCDNGLRGAAIRVACPASDIATAATALPLVFASATTSGASDIAGSGAAASVPIACPARRSRRNGFWHRSFGRWTTRASQAQVACSGPSEDLHCQRLTDCPLGSRAAHAGRRAAQAEKSRTDSPTPSDQGIIPLGSAQQEDPDEAERDRRASPRRKQ